MSEAAAHYSTRFVPLGSTAPAGLPPGEIWLDVGSRADVGVLDHHGGDTPVWSAAELVFERHEELLLPAAEGVAEVNFVLHEGPDLDAICSRWLAERILRAGRLEGDRFAVKQMVDAVSENDQGYVRAQRLEENWIIVLRTALQVDHRVRDDATALQVGLELLERSYRILSREGSLQRAAAQLRTPELRAHLHAAHRAWEEDVARATAFQLRLPVQQLSRGRRQPPAQPQAPPDPARRSWALADALHLPDPSSSLFKELTRGDQQRSPLGHGFSLMVVSEHDVGGEGRQRRTRHRISTDPLTGLHLRGLGPRLEQLEKEREEALGEPLPEGRERVEPGSGRHGYDVPSPWYDGRGHDFTIVDTPTVRQDGRQICGSLLTDDDVLEAVWDYGNPARFIHLRGAVFTLVLPVRSGSAADGDWPRELGTEEVWPGFTEEVLATFGSGEGEVQLEVRARETAPQLLPRGVTRLEQQLWRLGGQEELWVGRYTLSGEISNLEELAAIVHRLRWEPPGRSLCPDLELASAQKGFHVLSCAVPPGDLALGEEALAFRQAVHHLVRGEPGRFHDLATARELAQMRAVVSADHSSAAFTGPLGAVHLASASEGAQALERNRAATRMVGIALFALLHKARLDELEALFASHRTRKDARRASRGIIEDRWRLLFLRQFFQFGRISRDWFGQHFYEDVEAALDLPDRDRRTREKVEELARQIQEDRANLYERIAFWVSLVFLPLGLTASFFSGTHMQREFGRNHVLLTPSAGPLDGWIHFALVFATISLLALLVWVVLQVRHRRRDILTLTRAASTAERPFADAGSAGQAGKEDGKAGDPEERS